MKWINANKGYIQYQGRVETGLLKCTMIPTKKKVTLVDKPAIVDKIAFETDSPKKEETEADAVSVDVEGDVQYKGEENIEDDGENGEISDEDEETNGKDKPAAFVSVREILQAKSLAMMKKS